MARGGDLGSLVVRLGADVAGFRADLSKASSIAQKELGSIERSARGIHSSFRTLGAGLVAGLSVGALVSFVKSGIDAADQLGVISKRTGVTVEQLSVLKFAAEQSETSFDTLATGLQKFEVNLAKAGISGTQTIGMLTALADHFQQTEDPAKRLQIAVKAFGKSAGPELVPFLALGRAGIEELIAKAREMGLEISGDTAKAADDFNDQLKAMEAQLSQVAVIMGGSFIQALGGINEVRISPQLVSDIEAIGTALGKATHFAVEFAKNIGTALSIAKGLASPMSIPGMLMESAAEASAKKTKSEFEAIRANLAAGATGEGAGQAARLGISLPPPDKAPPPQADLDKFLASIGPKAKAGGGRKGGGKAKAPRDEFAEAMEGLQREIAMVGELTNAEKILFETQQGRYRTLTEAQKQALVGAAQQLDAATAAEEQERKSAQALDEMEASARELLKPVDELDRAFFEYNLQLEELQTLLDAGRLSQSEFAAATENLRRTFEEANFADPVKQQSEEMLESIREAARDMQDAMSDFFFDILQGKTEDFGARFKAFVDRMVADWLASQIQMAIFGEGFAGGGKGGGIGGILGSILGLFGGVAGAVGPTLGGAGTAKPFLTVAGAKGFAASLGNVIPFARGGLVGSPTVFPMANGMGLMGEAGPEAVLPLKRLAGGNLGVMANLSDRTESKGTGDVIVNFHLPGVRDDSEFKRSVGQSARNAAQLLERASRRNG
jgi:hypothetical protein